MKTLIYDKKQLERMLKDYNHFWSEGEEKDYLIPRNIDFINKQFPELPEEGLLVSEFGSLVYKLSDGSGYGFIFGNQSDYSVSKKWSFVSTPELWRKSTPEQKEKFIEMLKKECESRGLFEDTKIEMHAQGYGGNLNTNSFGPYTDTTEIFNKNGQIFYKGKFATPLKQSTLDQVTDAVKDISDFTIEESSTGLIILTPINK